MRGPSASPIVTVEQSMSFQDKVALVTGATSGIGRITAKAFAAKGARVVLSGRRVEDGQAAVREIEQAGGAAIFVAADVSKESDVKALIEATVARFGRLDIAFNNAGVEWSGPLETASEADYRRVFDTNVFSVITSMKYEVPVMRRTGGGVILNTSSIAGHIGMAETSLYIAAKHAVEGLTKSAALELAKHGIRVNSVAPAAIETPMFDRFAGNDRAKYDYLKSMHPIGRLGKPEDIANAALFLCSEQSSFITGTSLLVDGGFTAQ